MAASLDEEIKRRKAAAALLDNGDDGSGDDTEADASTDLPEDVTDTSGTSEEAASARPIYAPATKKGPSYVLVPLSQATKAREAAPDTSGHIDLAPPRQTPTPEATTYPTITEDQPEGLPKTPAVIPTPTPEYAGIDEVAPAPDRLPQVEPGALVKPPPSEYVGIDEVAPAPDKLDQVERATLVQFPKGVPATMPWHPANPAVANYNRNQQWTDPDPDNPDYKTPLSPQDELAFQAWVKKNKVPFDDSTQSDYDMRGFWKAAQEGDPDASTAVSKFDGKIHFNDKFKTPFHKTFSNESQYATSDAPHWVGDRLIDKDGNVVADETPGQKPAPIVQPAPSKLTQVERGQLVSTPPGTAPKAVGVAAPVTYPTIAEDQGAPGTPPKVQPAQPVTPAIPSPEAQPAAPRPRASQFGLTPDEYKASLTEQPATTTQATALPDASGLNINTDYTAVRGSYTSGRGGDGQVHGIILHASDGDEKSGIQTLTGNDPDHKVSAHYFVTKDGRIYQFVNDQDTAYQAGKTYGPHAQYNNDTTIGIEQEHVDGKELWSPAQVAATARLTAYLKTKYGLSDNDIMGHSDVAPGRKQDPLNYPWKGFFKAVDNQSGAVVATTTTGATSTAGATTAATGTQGYISGKATTFGYNDPDDSGVGAPKLGGLSTDNTDLIGIAVPEQALRNYVSAHPADWRKARVDVVTKDGRHVLVPIVDLGPRDTSGAVAADFTQGLTNLTGNTGDQNYQFKIIPNAGPDVMKNPQEFADEQAAIRAGINTGARFQPKPAARPSYVLAPLAPMSPAESIAAQTAAQYNQQGQVDTLDELNRNTENPGQMWKLLNQPIPGTVGPGGQPIGAVSDATRAAYADNFKQELTKYAQDFYGEKDPDKAFNRAVGDPNFGTFGQDLIRGAIAVPGQVDVGLNQAAKYSDFNSLDGFAKVLHPESDGMGRASFIKTITDIKDPNLRAQTIGKLWAELDPQKQAALDVNGIIQSADNVSSPQYQAAQNADIANKKALVDKLLTPDPSLKGTIGGWGPQGGQILANIAIVGLPKILQVSAFAGQIYGDTMDRIKQEHPDWTDQQVSSNAATSTVAQLAPQEILMAASHGILAPLYKWMGEAANPVMRFGVGGGVHLATGAAGGAIMQAGANVAEGQPIGQGVGEAAISGAVQAAPFAIHGAIHGALTPPEATTKAPLGQEPVTPPPETGPAGGAVRGAESRTLTGAEEGTPLHPPTPLAEQASALAGRTPEEVQAVAAQLTPPTDFTRQTVHLSEEAQAQPRQPVTQEAVSRRAYELYEERTKSGQPGTVADDYTQAQKELSQATEPPPATVSEAEPINSAIANRYVQERIAAGELGQIDPSEGKSTEDMVKQGLQMSRDQREGLIKNFMKGQGGDLDQQGAAIRAREAILSEQARAASRAADADPTNPNLQAQAKAASNAVTAFHNGPIKKFKKVWSNAGRGLQREIPLDYTTLNGMKEAYLKGKGNGNEAPHELEPRLKQMADSVSKTADTEQAALNNSSKEIGQEIQKKTRGKSLPNDDQIRARLMEIMKDLPCRT